MRTGSIAIALAGFFAPLPMVSGQTIPASSSSAFEVASVKPSPPSDVHVWQITGGPGTKSPGQFSSLNAPLRALLLQAWGLRPDQLIGPASLDDFKLDIIAKIPEGTAKDRVNLMLRNLLVERINLVAHTETRALLTYQLMVAPRGLKMKPAEEAPAGETAKPPAFGPPKVSIDADGLPALPPGTPMFISFSEGANIRLVARMQSLPALVKILERGLGLPVSDATGLTGTYDFTLLYAPDPAKTLALPPPGFANSEPGSLNARDPIPNLAAAVETQLGLRLQSKKTPGSVLVVDRYSRTPSAN